jgi:hypothetical protein
MCRLFDFCRDKLLHMLAELYLSLGRSNKLSGCDKVVMVAINLGDGWIVRNTWLSKGLVSLQPLSANKTGVSGGSVFSNHPSLIHFHAYGG